MRIDPNRKFRFRVEIDGIAQAGFSEVIMPEASVEAIDYREGTDPTHFRKLSGLTTYSNLVLKWGITESMDLYDWFQRVLENGSSVNRHSVAILLIDDSGNDKMRWEFFEAWPVKYKPSDLNAKANEVAIETLEIAFESFRRVA